MSRKIILKPHFHHCFRACSTKPQTAFDPSQRPSAELSPSIRKKIEKNFFHSRSTLKVINPPEKILDSFHHVVQNNSQFEQVPYIYKDYISSGLELVNFYMNRTLPLSGWYGKSKRDKIQASFERKFSQDQDLSNPDIQVQMEKFYKNELKKRANCWKPVTYDNDTVWHYFMGGKSAYDYACSKSIFIEIRRRLQDNFQPKTMLDFGSGLGSATWAAQEVFEDNLYEIVNIDESKEMNDFARMLIARSVEDVDLPSGYHYRFKLPRDEMRMYDLVTSCFTLLDLPTEESRLTHIESLWNRVEDKGFLVLAEMGTFAGFQALNEARELLIQLFSESQGHIFAPCPSEEICPKTIHKKKPCYFPVRFRNFPFTWLSNATKDHVMTGRYSYLIAQKGTSRHDGSNWPRLVEPAIRSNKNIICRLCTKNAKLEEIMIGKQDKELHRYCRHLPVGSQVKIFLQDKHKSDPLLESNQENPHSN